MQMIIYTNFSKIKIILNINFLYKTSAYSLTVENKYYQISEQTQLFSHSWHSSYILCNIFFTMSSAALSFDLKVFIYVCIISFSQNIRISKSKAVSPFKHSNAYTAPFYSKASGQLNKCPNTCFKQGFLRRAGIYKELSFISLTTFLCHL